MADLESDRVERTESVSDMDKFCIAACAFANDFPHHREPSFLLIGVNNSGKATGLKVTDKLLLTLGEIRASANVLPIPAIKVYKIVLSDGSGEVAIVEVMPSDLPPVRFRGQVWIRVGPRRAVASESEERILVEKRVSHAHTFDARPCLGSSVDDLAADLFLNTYRQQAILHEVIAANHRELIPQLAALRFYDLSNNCPTNAGILLFAKDPPFWMSGAYLQFLRVSGTVLRPDDVIVEKKIQGDLLSMLRELDILIDVYLDGRPVAQTTLRESPVSDYPKFALREFLMNAVMHRDYQSTAPVRFYWFSDRIEIQNPGSLYGEASPENFPRQNSYRNPVIAEAMKTLGYVNRFGSGVERAQEALRENGNPVAAFFFDSTYFLATMRARA
ncbi:MAG: ATP-binding protein [Limisphaerales bacterium]